MYDKMINLKTTDLNKLIVIETRSKYRVGTIVYKNFEDGKFVFRDQCGSYFVLTFYNTTGYEL